MAKKETRAPATSETTTTVTAPAPKPEQGLNDRFVRVFVDGKPKDPSKKVAPQAQVIINTIEAAGPGGVTREELVKNLTGVLVTQQPPSRILSYYQKLIVQVGAVEMTKTTLATA